MASFLGTLFEPGATSVGRKVRKAEERLRPLADAELRDLVSGLRERARAGEPPARLLPEAFAATSLAAERALGMRPFDVQVQGAVELARGKAVEMKTGEGKTLVATMPAVLHALSGRGVHVVTVNDYLARRDAAWMGPVFELLGLTVGCIQERMGASRAEEIVARRRAYEADVTYVTNSEAVFDYLRDNLARSLDEVVHRGFRYAIVDEVDLLLVDEAQTPLIIAGPSAHDPERIRAVDRAVRALRAGVDYEADRRSRTASLTDPGLHRLEAALGGGSLTDPDNLALAHEVYQALQAHGVFERDVEYVVRDERILLVDPHTGRVSEDKRFSAGLHQALEAKEGVPIRSDNVTLARTSYQHFFRGYGLLSGMTGTAWTARQELGEVYGLEVVRVPTNRPMIRVDHEPEIYRTAAEKRDAVVDEVLEAHEARQPVLVGTLSVEESEVLSALLGREGVPHEVLNAKQHEREAEVVAQAGRAGAVTISTNMAGRGTDIVLGGSPKLLAAARAEPGTAAFEQALAEAEALCRAEREEVVRAGGLLVVGTGEHESARIDEQLRGRSGRQGDPGVSVYFVSLDDPVYARAGRRGALDELRERVADRPRGEPLDEPQVRAGLAELRRAVEIRNQAARRDVFKIDSVVHERRESVWAYRRSLLEAARPAEWAAAATDLLDELAGRLDDAVRRAAAAERTLAPREVWRSLLGPVLGPAEAEAARVVDREGAARALRERYDARPGAGADEALAAFEREVLLAVIDGLWPDYLDALERTEDEVWMRAYAQVDPFVEFRKEAAFMFGELMLEIQLGAVRVWLAARPAASAGAGAGV